ncbi:hypothetical protein FKW77_008146 [Venturia effusa]|uniref:Phospholipase/carboxylesterase/thioesterase domain-containing protein n=1 Tax=Venturia effusa TaxID=50376 RepID=A0A517L3U5_9PEZI|nr:hypothetical protein FKW77_008146 [Venturia effusa]
MAARQHIVEPTQDHSHTFIFLHGRDSTAEEFALEFFECQASDDRTFPEIYPSIKWIFPTAKTLMSERFGTEMSQWFDMWSTEDPEERDDIPLAGLRDSVIFLRNLIRREAEDLGDSKRIILGGISQGCATAIHAFFNSEVGPLGGFIGLCSWLPTKGKLKDARKLLDIGTSDVTDSHTKEDILQTPVFLAHSLADPVINIKYGVKLQRSLRDLGMTVEWKTYDNEEHWITEPQGVDDIITFLNKTINS